MNRLFTLIALALTLLGGSVARAEPIPERRLELTPARTEARSSLASGLECPVCVGMVAVGAPVFALAWLPAAASAAGYGLLVTAVGVFFPPLLVVGPAIAVAGAIPVLGAFVGLPILVESQAPGMGQTVAFIDAGVQLGGLALVGLGLALEVKQHLGPPLAVVPLASPGARGLALAGAF